MSRPTRLLAVCLLGLSMATPALADPPAAVAQPRSNPLGGLFGRSAPRPAQPATTPARTQAAATPPSAPRASPQQRLEAERLDPLARAAFWSRESENDPRDGEAGVRLAHALRDLRRFDEAAQAAGRVLVSDPANYDAMLEAGRARIAQNQGFYAIEPLQHAAAARPNDWRPVSLLAIAYEQVQRDDEALAAYQRAVQMAPANAGLLVNLALYYAGHNDTAQAEQLLRRAIAMPGAPAQARQNLALMLGLQGRLEEAERLARQDLPPEMVESNLAYLRAASTTAPARSWDSVRGSQTP